MTFCTFLEQLEEATITKIGAWERSPQLLSNSCNFSEKKAILRHLDDVLNVFRAIRKS